MDVRSLLLAALLVTTTLAWLPAGESHPQQDFPNDIDVHETFNGDTFGIAIRSDQQFQLRNDSHFKVTGFFNGSSNGTGEPRQDAGAVVGVVRYFRGTGCGGCIFSMIGDSIKDGTDARVATDGPVTYTFDNDPNVAGWQSLGVGVAYPLNTTFQGPAGTADQVTYRFFASIPGASEVKVNLHLHANKPVQVVGSTSHDGGFMLVGDDFTPAGHVDTLAASGMVDGEATLDLAPSNGEHVYAYMSPSWFGTSAATVFGGGVAGTTNTAAVGDYGFDSPDGEPYAVACWVVAGPCGPRILGMTQDGPYRFFVNAEANVGPADMYVVGFEGPVS